MQDECQRREADLKPKGMESPAEEVGLLTIDATISGAALRVPCGSVKLTVSGHSDRPGRVQAADAHTA